MKYDGAGKYLGADFHGEERLAEFQAYREVALAQAEPFVDWWAKYGV